MTHFVPFLGFVALRDLAVIDPTIYIVFYIICKMLIDQNPPETHKKTQQEPTRIMQWSTRTKLTCWFKLRYICARLFVMVAHLDRLMKTATNRKVCKDDILSTSFILIKYVDESSVGMIGNNRLLVSWSFLEWFWFIPGRLLISSNWSLVSLHFIKCEFPSNNYRVSK